ncbi:unnamed protein product, partial [Rotaria magnacalcarata]
MATRKENKELITIVWYDSNIDSYNQTENINERLRQINDYVLYYNELEPFKNDIDLMDKEKIFLITSSSNASQINKLPQINAIFIFDFEKNQSTEFACEHERIIGIFNELDNLYSSIQQQIELNNELFQTFSFFDQSEYSTQDLSKQTSNLFWYQLFNDVILRSSHDQVVKNEMIDSCR